jgi:hypothetical protein
MPLIAGGVAAGGALLGGLFGQSSARKQQRRAERFALQQSQARGGEITGPFGSVSVSPENQINFGDSPFSNLSQAFAQQAQGFLQPQAPAINLAQAGIGAQQVGAFQPQIQQAFGGLQNLIGQQSQFDPNAFAATQFERLQSLARPGEERTANTLANQLFAGGRLGRDDTATGRAFEGLAQGQEQARTQRALQAIGLAGTERDRIFQEQQQRIGNQFGLLGQLGGFQQQGFQQLLGGEGFNQATQQQQLQNALGFGGAAGSVLAPQFQALTAILNRTAQDQAARAGVSTGVANVIGQTAPNTGELIGNVFGGLATGILNRPE